MDVPWLRHWIFTAGASLLAVCAEDHHSRDKRVYVWVIGWLSGASTSPTDNKLWHCLHVPHACWVPDTFTDYQRMNIHGNVSGDPRGDLPYIQADDGRTFNGDLRVAQRCTFDCPDTINGGFELVWDYERQRARGVFPPYPRVPNYEGGELAPPLPTISYRAQTEQGVLRCIGDRFWLGDHVWYWKGSTQFANLKQFLTDGPWEAAVDQALRGGGNIIRTVCMKANNRGWALEPTLVTQEHLSRYGDMLRTKGLRAELTVFCDTKMMMNHPAERRTFMDYIAPVAQFYRDVFLVEWINEAGHVTQSIDKSEPYKIPGVLCSRGSGGTDEYPPEPVMDYATYHGRRTARENDGRPVSNYSRFAWIEQLHVDVPFVNEETDKPPVFGFNTDIYHRMGIHARAAAGGTFHTDQGVTGQLMDPLTFACYEAFCRGVDGR